MTISQIDIRENEIFDRSPKLLSALLTTIGGWIERKEGLWIEGKDAKKLSSKYCARTAEQDLSKIPPYKSNKITRTGKYYI